MMANPGQLPFPTTLLLLLLLHIFPILAKQQQQEQDAEEGYLLFCPCMGRFGNQMEQFLGTLAFARHLNRTLVLPPLIEYPPRAKEAKMRVFRSLFQLAPLLQFHRVMPMGKFLQEIAPNDWPARERKVLCWSPRQGLNNPNSIGCHATEGNPFGPFWRHLGINFTGDEFFGEATGGFDTEREEVRRAWAKHFPVDFNRVLAFSSAPASFPIRPAHRPLQQYIQWTSRIDKDARHFIRETFGDGRPFVAVHLRNGPDWDNVCQHVHNSHGTIFASTQCTGETNEFGQLTVEACNPGLETVLKDIQFHVSRIRASGVFVAADWRHHLAEIRTHLANNIGWPVEVAKWEGEEEDGQVPARELAILDHSHHFIANCVSTFSAFVVRQRHWGRGQQPPHRRSCSFFAFPNGAMELLEPPMTRTGGDEL